MKKSFCSLLIALCAVLLCCSVLAADAVPKYVFLLIGDGMGKQHVDLARQINGKLVMDELPVRGSVSTVNAEKKTTDSAASGTAYACGIKTLNGRLGIDPQGKNVDSCAVLAKKQGRMVAILTTVGLNNATPAAFYAHVKSRGESKLILEQYPASGFDILAGSGIDGMKKNVKQEDFLSGKAYQMKAADAPETDNISPEFVGQKIRVIAKDAAPFFAMKELTQPVFIYSKEIDDLAKFVRKSIELMEKSPKGFFMMAEGGKIDYSAHDNEVNGMLAELGKFDRAVAVALEFYKQHPDETLIIVSADHHTGGLRLSDKIQKEYFTVTPSSMKINPATDSAEAILKKMSEKGIDCTDAERAKLQTIMQNPDTKKKTSALNAFIVKAISSRSGISWGTRGHTSDEVYLFAIGLCADQFAGNQENSDVGAKLKAMFSAGK